MIFDLDGTLVDSRLNFEEMRRDLNGANCATPFSGAHELLSMLSKNEIRVAILT
ncbi:MAG: hypothetical protein KBD78_06885 [Oligoflexales bacterium]|nr:hypothetical protein [Oligoflexales bacterium]